MLSKEVMGLLALAVLWVNTLLVVLAAWTEIVTVWKRASAFAALGPNEGGVGAIRARVARGNAESGALARYRVEQVGRYAADDADRRAIAFADRSHVSEVFGGTVIRVGDAVHEQSSEADPIRVAAADRAEVWPARSSAVTSAACASVAEFDGAYEQARKPRGFLRSVDVHVSVGDVVWIAGECFREGASWAFRAPIGGVLLVSAIDPRMWSRRQTLLLCGFIVAVLIAASLCTTLATHRPHFGLVSSIGAALGVAYFLLVQPAGTAIRDAVRPPHRAYLRGNWARPPVADDARVASSA